MKAMPFIFLTLVLFLFSCKKSNNDNSWTDQEKASYQAVIDLQQQAADNYTTWSLTQDSLTVLDNLKQFFLADPSVVSATIGAQGIAVVYANGMGGGIFLNPKDHPEIDSGFVSPDKGALNALKTTPLVNKKEMIYLDPHYWDRFSVSNEMVNIYNQWLPKAGYSLNKTYFDQYADVDQFTKLSGYGIVQIYSHGWAWPNESNIQDVYILSGEEANEATAEKYHEAIMNKEILVSDANMEDGVKNVFWISEKFIADHNDFSRDTVLFVGAFCYSFLGNMPKIRESFAAGTYVGFDWSVITWHCKDWSIGLISSMCDPKLNWPISSAKWFYNQEFLGHISYYDEDDKRTVTFKSAGDTTYLWKTPPPEVEIREATSLSPTGATLNARVNPKNFRTRVYFEYGTGNSYGKTVAIVNMFNWNEWQDASIELNDLVANTTYHYRAVARSEMGTAVSEDMTFKTTAAGMPSVTTLAASNVTALTATLNGRVNPNGVTAYGEFEYGETTAYGNFATIFENPLNGDAPIELSSNIQNLVSGQTYHYRINAYHQGYVDIVHGEDMTFVAVAGGGFQVGQAYGGGIIFAVEPNGLHGLIAAPSDQSTQTGAEWGCIHTEIPGADGTGYGTGNQNTQEILAGCPTQGIAARLCNNLSLGGYDDWYLPNSNELYSLYVARDIVGGFNVGSGWYWSSTESGADQAYMVVFSDGTLGTLYKDQKILVRAIRSF